MWLFLNFWTLLYILWLFEEFRLFYWCFVDFLGFTIFVLNFDPSEGYVTFCRQLMNVERRSIFLETCNFFWGVWMFSWGVWNFSWGACNFFEKFYVFWGSCNFFLKTFNFFEEFVTFWEILNLPRSLQLYFRIHNFIRVVVAHLRSL